MRCDGNACIIEKYDQDRSLHQRLSYITLIDKRPFDLYT